MVSSEGRLWRCEVDLSPFRVSIRPTAKSRSNFDLGLLSAAQRHIVNKYDRAKIKRPIINLISVTQGSPEMLQTCGRSAKE